MNCKLQPNIKLFIRDIVSFLTSTWRSCVILHIISPLTAYKGKIFDIYDWLPLSITASHPDLYIHSFKNDCIKITVVHLSTYSLLNNFCKQNYTVYVT